jgi:hypothetical protein
MPFSIMAQHSIVILSFTDEPFAEFRYADCCGATKYQ